MDNNFTAISQLRFWCQKVLPLVYDDSLSYYEVLCKIQKKLNDIIENNNLLPDFIMELIKNYISSGEIEKVLADVLANYMLNVKFPPKGLTPAKGDGTADDTMAIQGCIDYANSHGGMAVYFPSGKYLTQSLTLREKTTLFGQDRYTTQLVMKGGATNALLKGTIDSLSLVGLGFDGNMDIQVNNVNLADFTVNSGIITNVLFTDGFTLLNATINKDLQISNTIFDHAVENGAIFSGTGYVQCDNVIFNTVSALIGKNFIVLNTNNSLIENTRLVGATPNGILIGGNNNVVKLGCNNGLKNYVNNGTGNSIEIYTQEIVTELTGNITENVNNSTETVKSIKSITAKTVNLKSNENMRVDVTNDSAEVIGGNKTTNISGNLTETLNNRITTASGNDTETVSKTKTINSKDLILNPTNPITYKAPTQDRMYDTIPFLTPDKVPYKVLVENENTKRLGNAFINVKDYGAKGDGVTDDSSAIQSVLNTYTGNTIYFPPGTYIIGTTLVLPKHTVMLGSGQNSIFKPKTDNDVIKSVDYDKNMTNPPEGFNLFIEINNITINGGYFLNTIDYVKSGKTLGSGIKLYGNQIKLNNVTVTNCPEYGVRLDNVPVYNLKQEPELWYEPVLFNCSINMCGKDGLRTDYLFDFNVIACSIHTNGQSDSTYQNKWANFRIVHGNVKMVNSHTSSLYGPIKPYYSILLESTAGMCNITNSHIEGAYLPLYIGADNFNLSNSHVYGSFGEYDVVLHGNFVRLEDVTLSGQVGDPTHTYPQWKGAFGYENNCKNIYANIYLLSTKLDSDTSLLGYFNTFIVRGWVSDVNTIITTPQTEKVQYDIKGDFNSLSNFKSLQSGNTWFTLGIPGVLAPTIDRIDQDYTLFSPFAYFGGYTAGVVTYNAFGKRGSINVVMNNTDTDIPWVTTGAHKINGAQSGTFTKHKVTVLIGLDENEFVGVL